MSLSIPCCRPTSSYPYTRHDSDDRSKGPHHSSRQTSRGPAANGYRSQGQPVLGHGVMDSDKKKKH
jgi:hypothetical protein